MSIFIIEFVKKNKTENLNQNQKVTNIKTYLSIFLTKTNVRIIQRASIRLHPVESEECIVVYAKSSVQSADTNC